MSKRSRYAHGRPPHGRERRRAPRRQIPICGTDLDALTFEQAVEAIVSIAKRHDRPVPFIVTPNVDHVVRLSEKPELRSIYADAALRLVDGMPLVWASKFLGDPLPGRVTGADLLPALCSAAAKHHLSVFLLGGPPGAADLASQNLARSCPGLRVTFYCPPMGFERDASENERIVSMLNAQRPDVVFVGVGSPKQELWILAHRDELNAGVLLGVGAAIEFAAGTTRRAPRFMQAFGLEWIHRLAGDPKRLFTRYMHDLRVVRLFWKTWREKKSNPHKAP